VISSELLGESFVRPKVSQDCMVSATLRHVAVVSSDLLGESSMRQEASQDYYMVGETRGWSGMHGECRVMVLAQHLATSLL